ncbi:MAG: holo-ACP synthase [Pseudomonadota bacterium]|jgi:holo-[acyl-carrier protein] synthase|nr:holo-ACP synthase [Syntrophaceae bacterium]MBP7032897.1 holo-ACP synthase [Syntrophobacterales bacterium]MDI9555778.1 holo-ACP synthase [Pseudomonadota bacterium]NLX31142.1 holo-ACP synthase [Deltaproteobacteria bacterium]HNU85261.1 holo-ACP synthase [Syntrophales bacterium]
MIEAVGIDIADAERIRKALERWGDRFVARTFSEREAAYCRKHRDAALRYAARFAAKEAFLKCMGSARGIPWSEIELLNDRAGKPRIEVSERIRSRLETRKIRQVHVSVSHTGPYAVAVVVFET